MSPKTILQRRSRNFDCLCLFVFVYEVWHIFKFHFVFLLLPLTNISKLGNKSLLLHLDLRSPRILKSPRSRNRPKMLGSATLRLYQCGESVPNHFTRYRYGLTVFPLSRIRILLLNLFSAENFGIKLTLFC